MRSAFSSRIGMALVLAGCSACVNAATFDLIAVDSGFVTAMGGSAKGDSHLAPSAKFNYSVGYELHYAAGFYSAALAAMDRKNYFVFDLGGLPGPIVSATLVLWSGKLESADAFETYVLEETVDQSGALFDVGALAASPVSAFDGPGDFGVTVAASLYAKLGAGATALASLDITHALDDSFLMVGFTPAGISHLNTLRTSGGAAVLSGVVTTVDTVGGTTPQQPFGFTGPDIAGGGPLVPVLMVTTVPEPGHGALLLAGVGLVGAAVRQRRSGAAASGSCADVRVPESG